MAFLSPRVPKWWDRELDSSGKAIRVDVREAVEKIWKAACKYTREELGDPAEAAEIMEGCVAEISSYLDSAPAGQEHNVPALLISNFIKALGRRAERHSRMELFDDPDSLGSDATSPNWEDEINLQLDLRALLQHLDKRARSILRMRAAGYDWEEVAEAHDLSVSRAKHFYATELRVARRRLLRPRWNTHGSQH